MRLAGCGGGRSSTTRIITAVARLLATKEPGNSQLLLPSVSGRETENRFKEAQLDLFGTHASCSRFIANQFRLLLAALAYTLMQRLRLLALRATELERASAATIRVRLLKIGAAILRNTRRVRVMLASHHKLRKLFAAAATRLAALGP